ncbi:MAG: DUF3658 domain-containing protein [Methyloglobulus sp.]
MDSENPLDPPMTEAEFEIVARLSLSDIEKIDRQLLSNVVIQWRKLARIVVETMNNLENEYPSIPDLFYAQRVMVLAEKGLIESQGDLKRMRYSEVRLPSIKA